MQNHTWHTTMDRVAPTVAGIIVGLLIVVALAWLAHKADKFMDELQTPSYGRDRDPVD